MENNEFKLKDISVVIPSYNNLEYLKLIYQSIRDVTDEVELLLYSDGSTDGTEEWLSTLEDKNAVICALKDRVGHTILYDRGFNQAKGSIIGILHADMVVGHNFFNNILKYIKQGTVVCGTCIEPPLHPPGGEKIIKDFGLYPAEFNQVYFNNYTEDIAKKSAGEINESIFAPWFILKDEYLSKIGSHDQSYAPYGYEDSDLFSRMALAGFSFIQSRDAFVYHFTQRGHKWTKGVGIENDGYKEQMDKTRKIYIRKFGTDPIFDYNHKPVPAPKFDVGFIIKGSEGLIEFLEPWCLTLYTDTDCTNFIKKEQLSKSFDLQKKIKSLNAEKENSILVSIDERTFADNDFQIIQQLPIIIQDSGEVGEFQINNLTLTIKDLTEYQNNLIYYPYEQARRTNLP